MREVVISFEKGLEFELWEWSKGEVCGRREVIGNWKGVYRQWFSCVNGENKGLRLVPWSVTVERDEIEVELLLLTWELLLLCEIRLLLYFLVLR